MQVPLTADSVAPPRLVYGGLDPLSADGRDQAYAAIYFEVAGRDVLGRVTFEGLDAIRGSRGENLPYQTADQFKPGDWVFVVDRSAWLEERHRYEVSHYATPLLDTHQHYLFQFHDEFIEAIAEGIWLDHADRSDPFGPPTPHPLMPFGLDRPCERFISASGIEWELRRSPRADSDLIYDSQYCSQRVFQLNLLLDGDNREAASIWIRTTNGVLVSRISRSWVGEMGRLTGFAQPGDFSEQWETYLEEVAQRRRQMSR
jgi:hypothetical protein